MAKQNGRTNGTLSKQNGHLPAKPRRPRGLEARLGTREATQQFQEYIDQLRHWLGSLSDEAHAQALPKLTRKELFYVNLETTYENYQKGGPLREILGGTCFEGAL